MDPRYLILMTVTLFLPINATAQNYDAMMQQYRERDRQLTQQMQAAQVNIVQQNLQNPRVQQMYQQHLQQGGTMSPEQFAYSYAATAGFTPDGMQRWNQSERNIQQNDQAAIERYRENQDRNTQMMQQMHQRNSEIAHQRGNLLNGTTDYVDPNTGAQYNLPHTVQPNTVLQDPTGNTIYNNPQGNYQREDSNGYWHDLEEDD